MKLAMKKLCSPAFASGEPTFAAASLLVFCLTACDIPLQQADGSMVPDTLGTARAHLSRTVTVVSYNVNFGLARCTDGVTCTADAETLSVLRSLDADVILLQETTPAWEKVLRPLLAERYPYATFHDPSTSPASGIAAFSKFAIDADELLPSPVGWFPANRLVIDTAHGPLEVLNVHLRPMVSESGSWISGYFTTDHFRRREIDAYLPKLASDLPTVIAGDFNEDTNGDAFGHLEDIGFESALAKADPQATTWRWQYASMPLSLRLDHVAYEKSAFELVSAEVVEAGSSDHMPVKVVLRRRPT
ncbi:MAG: endonuclease/exonuclease/phosphatase family protein [Polyangiaceae bacterium]|nr:endonuclease/exonuclease/phosphatase family protein [Polyangiaceae bacterium]